MKETTYQVAEEARRSRRHKEPTTAHSEPAPSACSETTSNLSKPKGSAELASLKELEALVRALMDHVLLPQVWDNRLQKQMGRIEKARANN